MPTTLKIKLVIPAVKIERPMSALWDFFHTPKDVTPYCSMCREAVELYFTATNQKISHEILMEVSVTNPRKKVWKKVECVRRTDIDFFPDSEENIGTRMIHFCGKKFYPLTCHIEAFKDINFAPIWIKITPI